MPIDVLATMVAGLIVTTRTVGGLIDLYEKYNFGHLIQSTNHENFANAIKDICNNRVKYLEIAKK
jgi:glycosyltransferase involved in cell wall biosynthesis